MHTPAAPPPRTDLLLRWRLCTPAFQFRKLRPAFCSWQTRSMRLVFAAVMPWGCVVARHCRVSDSSHEFLHSLFKSDEKAQRPGNWRFNEGFEMTDWLSCHLECREKFS